MVDYFNNQAQSAARPTTRQNEPEKFQLKNDPQCGIPAGGTFCDLDCERLGGVYKDPTCLRDCESCYVPLVEDFISHEGVCPGSLGQTENNAMDFQSYKSKADV